MAKSEDTIENISDVAEEVIDIVEDLGLITEAQEKKYIAIVKKYKKMIIIACSLIVAGIALVNSL
tara:strand:+ start:250 stop:444 length:195 start_codon:yes stop_codon:yes gene_type:complete